MLICRILPQKIKNTQSIKCLAFSLKIGRHILEGKMVIIVIIYTFDSRLPTRSYFKNFKFSVKTVFDGARQIKLQLLIR